MRSRCTYNRLLFLLNSVISKRSADKGRVDSDDDEGRDDDGIGKSFALLLKVILEGGENSIAQSSLMHHSQ